MRISSAATALAIGKTGADAVPQAELRRAILPYAFLAAEEKTVAMPGDFVRHIDGRRKQGLRVCSTNRCDIGFIPGMSKVLTAAHSVCDRLIVGLNSDKSVNA